MPELPEVETIRRQLEPRVVGAEIVDAGSHWSAKFTPALGAVGAEIMGVRRRGKYLLFDLSGGEELIVHLGMTGRLAVRERTPEALEHPHLRAWWDLDSGGRLTFHDIRRFGRIHHVERGDHSGIPTLAALGPEPWDPAFTGRSLAAFVKRSDRCVKTLLLSQRPVAGIGNIYADEALLARPRSTPLTRRLSPQRAERLVEGIRTGPPSTPASSTAARPCATTWTQRASPVPTSTSCTATGAPVSPCDRCGTIMRRRVIDARSTTWWPHLPTPLGRNLADLLV